MGLLKVVGGGCEVTRVTVLMPVFNGAPYLAEALESVLRENIPDMEVLVFDDGSTDFSPEILARYDDPRLRVIRHANMGLAATLNKGIGLARGEYIARQDQDDLLLPGRLAKQLAFMDTHPEVAMVGTWAEIRVGDTSDGRFHRHPSADDVLRTQLLFDNPFVHSSIMLRTTAVRGVGGYSEDRSRQPPEDYELWSRIAHVHRVANLPEVLMVYREMPNSMSRTGINPFLSKVLRISTENLHQVLGAQWSIEQCMSLACLYHNAPSITPLSKRDARQMVVMAADAIAGGSRYWSPEMKSEVVRLQRHIESRFLRRRIPEPLLRQLRRLRNHILHRDVR